MKRNTPSHRSFPLAALVAFGLLLTLVPAARAGRPTGAFYSTDNSRVFWFVHLSDTHIGTSGSQDSGNLRWMVTTGKAVIAPSFMVVTGDLTDSTNGNFLGMPNGPHQEEWNEYKSILDPEVNASFFFDLPGNHDAYSDATFAYYRANSIQGRASRGMQVSWSRTFDWGKYHFLGVNTADNTGAPFSIFSPYGDHAGLDTTELAFISSDLNDTNNSDADLTMVFGHHPVKATTSSQDTYLYYGHQDFVHILDTAGASVYGYGHTHAQSDVQFAGNSYTGVMTGGGVRYLNIASLGKSSPASYDIIAVDCNGVSSVPATVGSWPVVLITAPVSRMLGTTVNPYSYTVPAAAGNPIRALVFDAGAISAVAFRIDGGTTWYPMTRVVTNPNLFEGVWDASALASGDHTITVQATGTTTKSHTITVRVTASNSTPVAANDTYSTNAGVTLTVAVPGVLGNDTDADGDPLTAGVVTGPAHGGLTLSANGSFTYTPAAGFSGIDSFTYAANDGQTGSAPATVTITVKAAATETVTITSATYTRKTSTLAVKATSSAQPNATLTVSVTGGATLGTMTYSAKTRSYSFSKKVTPAVLNVTVTSSAGGTATRSVNQK